MSRKELIKQLNRKNTKLNKSKIEAIIDIFSGFFNKKLSLFDIEFELGSQIKPDLLIEKSASPHDSVARKGVPKIEVSRATIDIASLLDGITVTRAFFIKKFLSFVVTEPKKNTFLIFGRFLNFFNKSPFIFSSGPA